MTREIECECLGLVDSSLLRASCYLTSGLKVTPPKRLLATIVFYATRLVYALNRSTSRSLKNPDDVVDIRRWTVYGWRQ